MRYWKDYADRADRSYEDIVIPNPHYTQDYINRKMSEVAALASLATLALLTDGERTAPVDETVYVPGAGMVPGTFAEYMKKWMEENKGFTGLTREPVTKRTQDLKPGDVLWHNHKTVHMLRPCDMPIGMIDVFFTDGTSERWESHAVLVLEKPANTPTTVQEAPEAPLAGDSASLTAKCTTDILEKLLRRTGMLAYNNDAPWLAKVITDWFEEIPAPGPINRDEPNPVPDGDMWVLLPKWVVERIRTANRPLLDGNVWEELIKMSRGGL